MLPIHQIVANVSVEGRVIQLSSKSPEKLEFLGSSLEVMLNVGQRASVINMRLPEGKTSGLVAVCTPEGNTFFIEIVEKDGKIKAILDPCLWVSDQYLTQIVDRTGSHCIEVMVGDMRFTSDPNPPAGYCKVDANLLCQLLIGEVEADEVIATADEVVAEQSEIERLGCEIDRFQNQAELFNEMIREILPHPYLVEGRDEEVIIALKTFYSELKVDISTRNEKIRAILPYAFCAWIFPKGRHIMRGLRILAGIS